MVSVPDALSPVIKNLPPFTNQLENENELTVVAKSPISLKKLAVGNIPFAVDELSKQKTLYIYGDKSVVDGDPPVANNKAPDKLSVVLK
jgi:hypothetical protein